MTDTGVIHAGRAAPRRSRGILRWSISCLCTAGVAVVAAHAVEWPAVGALLFAARGAWLALAIVANASILALWAAYWKTLLPAAEPRVSYSRMLEVVSIASALMNTLPFGGGHALSLVVLGKRAGTSASGALSLIALDQLGEAIVKVSVVAAASLLVPLPRWLERSALLLAVGALVLLAILVAAATTQTGVARKPGVVRRWAEGLGGLRDPSRALRALAAVAGMKGVEAVAIFAVQRSVGVHLPAGNTLFVLAAVLLGTALSLAPANLGAYEASVFVAYRHLGLSASQSWMLAVIQHACFILPAVGTGCAYVVARALSGRPLVTARQQSASSA